MHPPATGTFPIPLAAYASQPSDGLISTLLARIEADPFNAIATAIFFVAVVHTFFAARFIDLSHRLQHRLDAAAMAAGRPPVPSVAAELLHFLGEVEVIFALWAMPLVIGIVMAHGWTTATHYLNDTVIYTEPMFVVVIMALASTRPIVELAESAVRRFARLGGGTPAAWWVSILTIGPLLGSFVTEPGAMTISALLLARQFYDLQPPAPLKYATLGLLFVNVSIGGTLTHFAAPPILMVARPWNWDALFVFSHFGWRAAMAIATSTTIYYLSFRRDFRVLATRPAVADVMPPSPEASHYHVLPVPRWITSVYVLFIVWTVVNAHYPALFVAGFLFFLGFDKATAAYSTLADFKTPLPSAFSGRARRSRGTASLVDCPATLETCRDANVPRRRVPDVLQRQRAHHVSRDARAKPSRESAARRRGGRRHRRRADRDRQRTKPRRPGPARPLLRRRRASALPARGSSRSDRHRRGRLSILTDGGLRASAVKSGVC
jgi:hypothetical protein